MNAEATSTSTAGRDERLPIDGVFYRGHDRAARARDVGERGGGPTARTPDGWNPIARADLLHGAIEGLGKITVNVVS